MRRWSRGSVVGVVFCSAVFMGAAGRAQAAGPDLEKGPVVLVEEDDTGRFKKATAMIVVDAPPWEVFAVLRDMSRYTEFMPKVIRSDVTPHQGTVSETFDVRMVYDIPGPDTDYTARMSVDEEDKRIVGTWLHDDLRGSRWEWKVQPWGEGGTRALLVHSLSVKNFSPLLRQVDDDQQTVTVGVNVSTALVTVKALKRRTEALRSQARR